MGHSKLWGIKPKFHNKKLVADVGADLMTDKGNVYTGVCIDTNEGSGICAERNAMANMIIVSVLSFRIVNEISIRTF